VSILFADLAGSTSLHERLDSESVRRIMERYYAALRAVVDAHDGTLVKLMGDGVMAAFGVPNVREDDARRAVQCAMAMHDAFEGLTGELGERGIGIGLRVAVNSGEVVVRDDDHDIVGDPVNVAARLQQEVAEGGVIIGEATRRLVVDHVTLEPVGALVLKGRSEPVRAYRVVSTAAPSTRRSTTFVGRDVELRRLVDRYDGAVRGRRAELAVVLGSPGLGKSRLLDEVVRHVAADATVIAASCVRGAATFAPLVEPLRALLGIDDKSSGDSSPARASIEDVVGADVADREQIVDGILALLSGAPGKPEETFFVVRRLVTVLATHRPVVVVLDDLHWAEPLLLDLTEHLAEWTRDVALLVLVAARPELRDVRSALAVPGRLVGEVVALDGLDAGAAARLAADVVGTDELPAGVAGHVLATSEGNPLFLGELVRMLVDDGVLRRDGTRWTAAVDLAELELPPTISALLSARIERLRPDERTVVECAAVIGRQFSRAALDALLAPELRAELDSQIEALRRAELIEPDPSWFLGEPMLRFHHVLIREAAYQRLLRETRADLHVRFADWLASVVGEAAEHDEMLGLHLEAAHEHRRELGVTGAEQRALGERAADHLAAAGRRALERDDVAAAASLLGRAVHCLDPGDERRAELALDWSEALLGAGDVDHVGRALDELDRWTATSPRLAAWHACFLAQRAVLTDPQSLHETAERMATAATELAASGDDAGEAKASFVRALALSRLGEFGGAEVALDRALVAARRVGDWRRANAVLAGAPIAHLWGPRPVIRASGNCLDVVRVLRITAGSPAVEAVALRSQAVLEALRGRFDAARTMLASSRRAGEDLGLTHRVLEADMFAGIVELIAGEVATAERLLRAAYDGLRDRGLGTDAAQAAALLGRAQLRQGRVDEAIDCTVESERLAGDGLQAAIAWRCVRAEALASRGEHVAAAVLARAAVELAARTDALLDHADARVALAVALRAGGREREADAELARAIDLWEAKGATALVERHAHARWSQESRETPREQGPPAPARPHVRPNAASRYWDAFEDVLARRDYEAFEAMPADDVVVFHHRTRAPLERQTLMRSMRSLFQAGSLEYRLSVLATLGDSLALAQWWLSIEDMPERYLQVWGETGVDDVVVLRTDTEGRAQRVEQFPMDDLARAIVRLYELYAETLPPGPMQVRAAASARTVEAAIGANSAAFEAACAADVEVLDHRAFGLGVSRGRDAATKTRSSITDVARDVAITIVDVLAASPDALLDRRTQTGELRSGGGDFHREFLHLVKFGPDGELTRAEMFDDADLGAALSRLDELSASPTMRRVRPNAATAYEDGFAATLRAGDFESYATTVADDLAILHVPTQTTLDRVGLLATVHSVFHAGVTRCEHEHLATLGESLALVRWSLSIGGLSEPHLSAWGTTDIDETHVVQTDAAGRLFYIEQYAPDQLADAVIRLYRLYAESLPEGADRDRASSTARSVALTHGGGSEEFRSACSPDVRFHDHRLIGVPDQVGPDEFVRGRDSLLGSIARVRGGYTEVLALESDGHVVRIMISGVDRATSGALEIEHIMVSRYDRAGLLCVREFFPSRAVDAALRRFDELRAERAAEPFENEAARVHQRVWDLLEGDDWDALEQLFAPAMHYEDRRALNSTAMDRQVFLSNLRQVKGAGTRATTRLLATRGERLALFEEHVFTTAEHIASAQWTVLRISEIDEQGRRTASVTFDVDDVDAAYDELERRFREGEGAPHAALLRHRAAFERAIDAQDATAMEALIPETFTLTFHHNLAAAGSVLGRDEVVALSLTDGDLGAPSRWRTTHLRISGRAAVWQLRGSGTVGGGDYESTFVVVGVHDGARFSINEGFAIDDVDAAFARFAELSAPTITDAFENAASRGRRRAWDLLEEGDWGSLEQLVAPTMVAEDRRTLNGASMSRDVYLRSLRLVRDAGAHSVSRLLATRGERLALFHERITTTASRFAEAEWEQLQIVEVDGDGRRVANVTFDAGDVDAAHQELDERFRAGEGEPHATYLGRQADFYRAVMRQDRGATEACLPRDFTMTFHRGLAGAGSSLTRDEFLELACSDAAINATARWRTHHLRVSDHALLWFADGSGTLSGGDYEMTLLGVAAHDGTVMHALGAFALDDVDAAFARFTELSAPRDVPLRIPPNAATRTNDLLRKLLAESDWEGLRRLYAPGFVWHDHRRSSQLVSDAEGAVHSSRFGTELGLTMTSRAVLAALGDHVALEHMHWSTTDSEELVVADILAVTEVDEAGRYVTSTTFDVDDRGAAEVEAFRRFAESGATEPSPASLAVMRAMNSHDPARLRAVLHDDFTFADHRHAGLGQVEDVDTYVASFAAMWQRAPDMTTSTLHYLAGNERGSVTLGHLIGTFDGGDFESPFVRMVVYRDGLLLRGELFEPTDVDAALARFAELTRAELLRIPPNAATRFVGQYYADLERRDRDGIGALFSPDVQFVDERPSVHLSGGLELVLANTEMMIEYEATARLTALATLGDRLSLHRQTFVAPTLGGVGEKDSIAVTEVDAAGRCVASVFFEADQRAAAEIHLFDQYAPDAGLSAMATLWRVVRDRDLDAVRTVLDADVVIDDHRHTGVGRLDRRQYVESLAAVFAESSEWVTAPLTVLAANERGHFVLAHTFGRRDGGDFETVYLAIWMEEHGRVTRIETFELDEFEAARARFAEITRGDPLHFPPTLATRRADEVAAALRRHDWEWMRALCAPGFVWYDGRRGSRLAADVDMYVASLQIIDELALALVDRGVLASLGETLVLEWTHFSSAATAADPIDAEALAVVEIDASGRLVATTTFDPSDRLAAELELFERWAGQAAPVQLELLQATVARDLDRVRMVLDPSLTVEDHRRGGMGRLDSDGYVDSLSAVFAVSSQWATLPLHLVATSPQGTLSLSHTVGVMNEGGEFETVFLSLTITDESHVTHVELFDLDDVAAARARFDDLCADDPLRIPPNAATRAIDRYHRAVERGDVSVLREWCTLDMVFDDRRRAFLLRAGLDAFVASGHDIAGPETRVEQTWLATWGERVALGMSHWTNTEQTSDVEPYFNLVATDAEGRISAYMGFDADDRATAFDEAARLFVEGEAAAAADALAPARAMRDALNRRDWISMRAALSDDFLHEDRRGIAIVAAAQTAEEWIASLRALVTLAPDVLSEQRRVLAWDEHGQVAITWLSGTRAVDGGPFENVFVNVHVTSGGRLVHAAMYEPEQLDAALARFEELRPSDPVQGPSNAATRAADRLHAAIAANDVADEPEWCAADCVMDDRRRGVMLSGGRDMLVASCRVVASGRVVARGRAAATRTTISELGDRVSLERVDWRAADASFETSFLGLTVVDADGRITESVAFDVDDVVLAMDEAGQRFAADEAASCAAGLLPAFAFGRAFNQRDWATLRSVMSDDFVCVSHRALAVFSGAQTADEWIAAVHALVELAPDVIAQQPRALAWAEHGQVAVTRMSGTIVDGGPFEAVIVNLHATRAGRVTHYELFDVDDVDAALARFEELRP
jgi:class 3 adenylate cyclase/tetratricopeptide (TPR) repeat protein